MAPGPEQYYRKEVLGLTGGELFVIGFVVFLVVSARYWPMLGERAAQLLTGRGRPKAPDANKTGAE